MGSQHRSTGLSREAEVASERRRTPRVFYGWWIVLAGAVGMGLNAGTYFYGMSTFFIPLTREFGWSRTALSGAISLARLESGLFGPVEGYLVDRFGPRKMMFIGFFLLGLGFILLSRVHSLFGFYFVFILFMAVGSSFSSGLGAFAAATHWFRRKRSRAIGFLHAGLGFGGVTIPALAWIVSHYGWREAAVVAGVAMWVVGFPVAAVMRHKPEQYGYLPDGAQRLAAREADAKQGGTSAGEAPAMEQADMTPAQAMHTPAFWLLAICFGIVMVIINAVAVHQIPYLEDKGFSPAAAAGALGLMTLISVPGRLGFGWLGDYLDKRYVITICFALQMVGLLILAHISAYWHILLFLVIYAPAYGGRGAVFLAIMGDYFGRRHFATIRGFSGLFSTAGTVAGPVFAGYVFDATGSYYRAFLALALLNVIAIAFILAVRRPVVSSLRSHAEA